MSSEHKVENIQDPQCIQVAVFEFFYCQNDYFPPKIFQLFLEETRFGLGSLQTSFSTTESQVQNSILKIKNKNRLKNENVS